MVAMTAFTSALYVAFLMPFNSVPLIPGFMELRPASLLPVISGFLLGPAGAWGCAIGSLVGDLFGTLSPATVFLVIGNFINAYIAYKLWGQLGISRWEEPSPTIDSSKKLVEYGALTIISSAAGATVVAWGCDALRLAPFAKLAAAIFLSNSSMALVLGPICVPFLHRLIKRWGLLWTDILKIERRLTTVPKINSILIVSGALGGFAVGMSISLGMAGQSLLEAAYLSTGAGHVGIALSVLPFLAMLLYGLSKI